MLFSPLRAATTAILAISATAAAVLAVVYCYALSAGHDWGDDFGLYLQIADNIAAGRPRNALTTDGEIVPSGFPYLLAAWATIGGWEIRYLKLLNVLACLASAAATFELAKCFTGRTTAALCGVTVLALPGLVFGINTILTDLPFLAASTGTLWLACRYETQADARQAGEHIAILAALALTAFLAMWLRTAGIALPVALGAHYAWRIVRQLYTERVLDTPAVRAGVAVAFALLCTLITSRDSIRIYLAQKGHAAVSYNERFATEFSHLVTVFAGFDPFARSLAPWIITSLAVLAIIFLWQRGGRPSPLHWFTLVYAAMLINTPWTGGMRYLYPLVPPLLVMAVAALKPERHRPHVPPMTHPDGFGSLFPSRFLGLTALLPLAVYGIHHNATLCAALGRQATMPITTPDDARSPEAIELAEWLQANTPSDAVLLSFKPRAVSFFARRTTLHMGDPYVGSGAEYISGKGAHAIVMGYHPHIGYSDVGAQLMNDPTLHAAFDNSVYRVFVPRQESTASGDATP